MMIPWATDSCRRFVSRRGDQQDEGSGRGRHRNRKQKKRAICFVRRWRWRGKDALVFQAPIDWNRGGPFGFAVWLERQNLLPKLWLNAGCRVPAGRRRSEKLKRWKIGEGKFSQKNRSFRCRGKKRSEECLCVVNAVDVPTPRKEGSGGFDPSSRQTAAALFARGRKAGWL